MRARWARDLWFPLVLVALDAAFRLRRFVSPLDDAAVGLYVHVANALGRGALPYVTAYEYKPPGLFFVYALAERLVPDAAVAVQVLAIAASVATSLAVARLADDAVGAPRSATGRLAALFALTLSLEHDGWAGDAEVLLAPFVAWSIAIAARPSPGVARSIAIGLLAGLALQCKLSAVPLLVVPLGLVVVRSQTASRTLVNGVAALAGIAAPIAAEAIVYARAGALQALVDANVGATVRRADGLHSGVLVRNLGNVWAQFRVLAPAIELAPFASAPGSGVVAIGWAWIAAAAVAIAAAGEFYARHFALLDAPVALLGALGLARLVSLLRLRARDRRIVVVVAVLASFALHDFYELEQGVRLVALHALGRPAPADPIDEIAALLGAQGACERSLYVVEESPWLYDLAGAESPTRFADSDHLFERALAPMADVDPPRELARVFATRPTVVVVGDLAPDRLDRSLVADLRARLARSYVPVGSSAGAVAYVRRGARCGVRRGR